MSRVEEYLELCNRISKGLSMIESFDKVDCQMKDFMMNDQCSGCFITPDRMSKWCKAWRLLRRLMKQFNKLWESMSTEERKEAERRYENEQHSNM